MRTFRLTISILLFTFLRVHAQDTLTIEQRITLLEKYNERVLHQEFETQSNKLQSTVQIELERAKNELTDEVRILKIVGGVISFILAAGLVALILQYFVGIRKMAEKILGEKLKSHLEENSAFILDLITSQKVENQVRKSKHIYVVAGDEKDLQQSLKLLKDMKFSKVEGKVYRYYEKAPDSDLIIFSTRNGSLPDELVIEFMEKGSDAESYVFFGSRLAYDTKASYAERLNFANSQYTLYHQIISMLSFKDVINS